MNFSAIKNKAALPKYRFIAAVILLMCSMVLIGLHVSRVKAFLSVVEPAVSTLPQLKQRASLLEAQVAAARIEHQLRNASGMERIEAHALPDTPKLKGIVDAFEAFLRTSDTVSQAAPLQIGDVTDAVVPVSIHLSLKPGGERDILTFIDLSGRLSLSDALTPDERANLLKLTEHDGPAALLEMQRFLSMDILAYAEDEPSSTSSLRRALSNENTWGAIETILHDSALRGFAALLHGEFAETLQRQHLWPLRLMTLKNLTISENGMKMYVEVEAHVSK